jgi:methylglutaconyl-CoA hydratase
LKKRALDYSVCESDMDDLLESIDARGVATLTLNRPHRRNAFDEALVSQLTSALRRVDANNDVRAVVLSGAGSCFCAGGDIEWMKRAGGQAFDANLADAVRLAEMMRVLDQLSKPTVALVHGAAYGGGVGLVACCDIAIATADATFCLSEVKLGIIPAVVSPYIVRSIGARQARKIFLTAEIVSAEVALRIGLVHEVVGENEKETAKDQIVNALLLGAPGAQRESKLLIAHCNAHPIDDKLTEETARLIAKARGSAEGIEGLNAFLNKRPPAWRTIPDA